MESMGFIQPEKEYGEKIFFDLETYKGEEAEMMAEYSLEFDPRVRTIDASFESEYAEANSIEDEKEREKKLKKVDADHRKAVESLNEKAAEWLRKAALKNSARILCAVFVRENQDTGEIISPIKAYTWMPVTSEGLTKLANVGVDCIMAGNEAEMLIEANHWLASLEPIDFFSGHNIFGFDLRKWRGRCGRHNIGKAPVFSPQTGTRLYDTMYEYGKYVSMSGDQYTSLNEVAAHFQIPFTKLGSGAEVAELYESGQYETIIAYCAGDVLLTRDVANRMIKEC